MQIEGFMTELRNNPPAVRVKTALKSPSASAPQRSRRDRAEFDHGHITYAKAVNSADKASEQDGSARVRSAITSEKAAAEIYRQRISSPKSAEAPHNADSCTELLNEQIKSVSKLLSDKSGDLPLPVKEQLENIYSLLCDQKKTDPNSVSEDLQNAIDKLSDMLSSDKTDKEDTLAERLEQQRKQFEDLFSNIANKDNTLGIIKNKIRQGKKLTAYEQQTLSAKDPAAYESYRKVNAARSMFRCSLNNCRTRDDVIGMRMSNALTALSGYKKAIREGGDGGGVIALNAAFENEFRDFTKSSGFRALPTVAECNKFDRDISKARKYEREKRLAKRREQLRSKKYKKKVRKTIGDGKRTVAQVLADPKSKKVLASRAKRTYCSCARDFTLYMNMNSKA